jgi:L-methionine (R)-S-oxide reductase
LWHAYKSLPAPSSEANWAGELLLLLPNLVLGSCFLVLAWRCTPTFQHPLTSVGFYVLDPSTPNQLILGPFHGKVACQTIKFGKGVCGTAAEKMETQLVPDVEAFPGHIACDGNSKSEIVVPILVKGKVAAIIDIDCADIQGFDEVDRGALEDLAELLARSCDW